MLRDPLATKDTSRVSTEPIRWAGLAGLGFAVSVAIQNRWSQVAGIQPDQDAPAAEILATVVQNTDAYTVLFSWVALNVVLIMVFFGGAYVRLIGEAPMWTAVGLVGGISLLAFFSMTNIPLVGLVVAGNSLAGSPILVDLLWDLHLATFAFAGISLGATLFGLSLAAVRAGLVPAWYRIVGPLGALVLIAGSVPVRAVAQGVPATMVVLIGFVVWLVFLGTFGFRLWREAPAVAAAPHHGELVRAGMSRS